MKKVCLHDGWTFKDPAFSEQISAAVPGCLHTDLIRAGIIKDLYYRDNNNKYLWVENCSPIYELTFDAECGKNVRLNFEGIDTFANVYLNGIHLGEVHNMFIPHSFDVSDVLKSKDNHLRVEFISPIKAVEKMRIPGGYAFTGDRINARRIQCTYSWDWVDRFVTMGIFRPVYLEYREGLEIEDVYVRTDALDRFGASIVAEYTLSGFDTPGIIEAEIVSPDGSSVYKDRFYADRELVVRKMDISSPLLWYPNGYGAHPLYTFRAASGSSKYSTRFGIRTLRIINLQDHLGDEYYNKGKEVSNNTFPGKTRTRDDNFFGFRVIVNDKEIFCRGGNWVPCDPFASEESDEKIRDLVFSAADMGANILRVWGGGLFEKKTFYDCCDEQGLLVCHDFLMACGEYPEKEEWFIKELLLESEYAVKLMRNHPSLAWFHGDNENAVDGNDILHDYTGRDSALKGIFPSIYKFSKNVPFLESSPWGGNSFSSITAGTSHNTNFLGEIFDYCYSTDCHDYKEYFAQFTSRFVSEEPTFGAICRESMLEFLRADDITGDDESMLKHHAKTNPGLPVHIYDDIRAFAEHVLGEFTDGEDRYFKMKYIQCEWVRITQELVLRNLGYSNGIIYWMYNDCWPASLGWAFVDYYRRRKPSYYAFKRVSAHVTGSFEVDGNSFVVTNTSDSQITAKAVIRLLDVKNGFNELSILKRDITLSPYSTVRVDTADMNIDGAMLVLDVVTHDSSYRSFWKMGALHLRKTDSFTIREITDNSVTVTANEYIHALELEGDYRFSDNYFIMLKGQTVTVEFDKFSNSANGIKVNAYTIM